MARDIDRVINFVRTSGGFPPIIEHVIVSRLDKPPTSEELSAARAALMEHPDSDAAWRNRGPEINAPGVPK